MSGERCEYCGAAISAGPPGGRPFCIACYHVPNLPQGVVCACDRCSQRHVASTLDDATGFADRQPMWGKDSSGQRFLKAEDFLRSIGVE